MFTLLTTLLSFSNVFLLHLTNSNLKLINTEVYDVFAHITYGINYTNDNILSNVDVTTLKMRDGISCMCSYYPGQQLVDTNINNHNFIKDIEKTIDYLLASYIENDRPNEYWDIYPQFYSCTLLDGINKNVWLISDYVGSTPLWYALPTNNHLDGHPDDASYLSFMITSDLIAAKRLGYNNLTPLGSGQMISIDIKTNEIISFNNWESKLNNLYNNKEIEYVNDIKFYSYKIFSSALNLISKINKSNINNNNNNNNNNNLIVVEIDNMDISSAFTYCTIDSLGIAAGIKKVNVLASNTISQASSILQSILKDLDDPRDINSAVVRYPKFNSIALDRWNFCKLSLKGIAISYITGIDSNPIEIYLQNLLCAVQNTSINYIYNDYDFQLILMSTLHPSSMFHQAFDLLINDNVCNSTIYGVNELNINYRNIEEKETCNIYNGCFDYIIGDKDITINTKKNDNFVGQLYNIATKHADKDKKIILVLATSGYKEMLVNFLCSAMNNNVNNSHIVVLTPNQDISDLVANYNVGVLMSENWKMTSENEINECNDNNNENSNCYSRDTNISDASFGSLSYQELMYFRTDTVMKLLLLGFNPIIADIDTVWKSDPFIILSAMDDYRSDATDEDNKPYDIAVTDDNGEICGCFISIKSTYNAKLFWLTVLNEHYKVIMHGRNNKGNLKLAFDSEQKIITSLLLGIGGKVYDGFIVVKVLPTYLFPSGLQYFNLRTHIHAEIKPVIIHNNFIVGQGIKKIRFERYNLWNVSHNENETGNQEYVCGNLNEKWNNYFNNATKDINIPLLSIIVPAHNSISNGDLTMVQTITEGISIYDNGVLIPTQLWFERDPPSSINFNHLGIYSLSMHANNSIASFTSSLINTNLNEYVDIGINRSYFAIDRNGKHHEEANEKLLKNKRINYMLHLDNNNNDYLPDKDRGKIIMKYSIKILTFNRISSLKRLLDSLLVANYMEYNVSMDIYVDYNRTISEGIQVEEVKKYLHKFKWPYGILTLIYRPYNIGLERSWYFAWGPKRDDEAAFIFEDDIVVSKYFFWWSLRAVDKYYTKNSKQYKNHLKLLNFTREHINLNGNYSSNHNKSFSSPLDEFAHITAGDATFYGICLQKQDLDPSHYPKKLNIENSNQPFLYSLIGSWGPLLLPLPWLAFKEWWRWKSNSYYEDDLLTETLLVNYFYKNNPKIWTPWIVRFSYETGIKCLYSNLPNNLSLVTNFRESGENYHVTEGPETEIISSNINSNCSFDNTGIEYIIKNSNIDERFNNNNNTIILNNEIILNNIIAKNGLNLCINKTRTYKERMLDMKILHSLLYLPNFEQLKQHQYDFNIRNAGTLGINRLYYFNISKSLLNNKELVIAYNNINQIIDWEKINNRLIFAPVNESISIKNKYNIQSLSANHYYSIVELINQYLLPSSNIYHLGITSLLPMTLSNYWNHYIFSNNINNICNQIKSGKIPGLYNKQINNTITCINEIENINVKEINFNNRYNDILIINLRTSISSNIILEDYINFHTPFEYILFISNTCSSGFTDIEFKSNDSQLNKFYKIDTTVEISYSLVDDICTENEFDLGGSLFRYQPTDDVIFWKANRVAKSRRIFDSIDNSILVTRHFDYIKQK